MAYCTPLLPCYRSYTKYLIQRFKEEKNEESRAQESLNPAPVPIPPHFLVRTGAGDPIQPHVSASDIE